MVASEKQTPSQIGAKPRQEAVTKPSVKKANEDEMF